MQLKYLILKLDKAYIDKNEIQGQYIHKDKTVIISSDLNADLAPALMEELFHAYQLNVHYRNATFSYNLELEAKIFNDFVAYDVDSFVTMAVGECGRKEYQALVTQIYNKKNGIGDEIIDLSDYDMIVRAYAKHCYDDINEKWFSTNGNLKALFALKGIVGI